MPLLTGWIMLSALAALANVEKVTVEFDIWVPSDTPRDAQVYLVGNIPALHGWSLPGLSAERVDSGHYRAKIEVPTGTRIEYKLTRGSWETVEKDAAGAEIANRTFSVDGPAKIEVTVGRWAGGANPTGPIKTRSVTGDVKYHPDFPSKYLKNERTIVVYLPPDYEKKKKRRYPVLYMHDGQNLFDASTSFIGIEWQADEHAERLIKAGTIEPLIIVGLYNTPDRMNEYAPDRDEDRSAGRHGDSTGRAAKGDAYAKFLVEEVKPFIDKTYRTRPDRANTGVAGSSMGGLISLYICYKYPKVFSRCGILSPSLMWNDRSILKKLEKDHDWMKGTRFWLDMGTEEGRQIPGFSGASKDTRRLAKIFDDAGLAQDRDYRYLEVAGGQHNEGAWAARFDQVLEFFYPAE